MKYRAFISYSHEDKRVAKKLHTRLENYSLPRAIRSNLAESDKSELLLRPIFLDSEELGASTELSDTICEALKDSMALIVVCSPFVTRSKWVNREIKYFREFHPDRPIFAFVVGGDPSVSPLDDPEKAAFPVSFFSNDVDQPDGTQLEPLAADARKVADGFNIAFLRLVAGLLDIKFDQLRQRELRRQQKRLVIISVSAVSLSLAFAIIAWQAVEARKEADKARLQAEIELTTERQTREFLLSVFRLADPSEARGNTVTVREVLDRSVDRITNAEFSSSLIKAKLTNTMASAYSNLGLYEKSLELFGTSSTLFNKNDLSTDAQSQKISNMVSIAEVNFLMGNYEPALEIIDKVYAEPSFTDLAKPLDQIRILNIKGDVSAYIEEDAIAEESYTMAIQALDNGSLPINQDISERSRSLGGLALLAHFQGNLKESEELYTRTSSLLSSNFGEDHPDSIWASLSLASAAYLNGNYLLAQDTWEKMLVIAVKVLGKSHPEIATIRNSLGLIALERGNFSEARTQLQEAIGIDRSSRSENFDDLVYPLTNLAVLNIFEKQYPEANTLLASDSNHRWRGPVSNYRADLACLEADFKTGIKLAEQAINEITNEFGEGDWRVQQAEMTQLFCQASAGIVVDKAQVEKAIKLIEERWGQPISYTQRAIEQGLEIFRKMGDLDRLNLFSRDKLGWSSSSEQSQ